MTDSNLHQIAMFINLVAASFCGAAFILNVIHGNIPLAILMAILVPLNIYIAYVNFKRMIKSLGK